MLSWKDDDDQKPARSGSLRGSTEISRLGSARKSVDYPTSPSGSLPKAPSLMRPRASIDQAASSPGADSGKIGSAGWWHAGDHGYLNEEPEGDASKKKPGTPTKGSGFVAQNIPGVTGQRYGSIFADEDNASSAASSAGGAPPAASAPAAAPAAPVPPPAASSAPIAMPGAPTAAAIAAAAVGSPAVGSPADAAIGSPASRQQPASMDEQIKKQGWWTQMDNSILNAPPESAGVVEAGAVKKGERVFGGGFTPQFALGIGKSLFADEEPPKPAAAAAPAAAADAAADTMHAWDPFANAAKPTPVN